MRKLTILLAAVLLCSCSAQVYKFKKGDTVVASSLGGMTEFEIVDTAARMG